MNEQPVPEIDVEELADRAGTVVIDVREPHEYEAAHVPGAKLIPLREVPSRLHEIPGDAPVALICAVGSRSLRAAEFLIARGIDATNVAGGTKAWIEAGRPVDTGLD